MRGMKAIVWGAAVAGAWSFVAAPSASAGLTDVRPAAAGEAGHEQILEHLYGVDFDRSGADWVSDAGGLRVRRVDDSSDGRVSLEGARRLDLVAAFTSYRWDFGVRSADGRTLGSASQSGSGFDADGGFAVSGDGDDAAELYLQHANGTSYASRD